MNVTVVIPTRNREQKLIATIEHLLATDVSGIHEVEVIVVDDGSTLPVRPLLDRFRPSPPFLLSSLRRDHGGGPAAARNAGFRRARGEVVVFLDDDILAPRDLISRHLEAHRLKPGTVVCGRWRYIRPEPITPLYRYLESLGYDSTRGITDALTPMDGVSSCHLSVERAMFSREEGVYRDDLAVPAAEETELWFRLRRRGIPILSATKTIALHDHDVLLKTMCLQTFKHAMGFAEAAMKYPGTLELTEIRHIMNSNGPISIRDRPVAVCKKAAKHCLSLPRLRAGLIEIVAQFERYVPNYTLLAPLYHLVLGSYFFAGVREGIKVYGSVQSSREVAHMASAQPASPLA